MNRFFTALAALAVGSGSALAADMSPPMYKAPPPPPPAPTWTGCDINAGGGYGMWNQDHSVTGPFGPGGTPATTVTSTTDGGRGWLGRFGGGCDYQFSMGGFGNFVVGAFGDFDVMSLRGSLSPSEIFPATGPGISPITSNVKENDAVYAGARLGYLVSPTFLAYFDGGWTQTRFTQTGEFQTATGTPINFGYPNFTTSGWFIGSGYEYAFNFSWFPIQGVFWRTEYRFAEYNTRNLSEANLTTGVLDGNVLRTTPFVQTITSSLVWRFNFNGPMAAMPH
jgi:outer membrane immunogenic protein